MPPPHSPRPSSGLSSEMLDFRSPPSCERRPEAARRGALQEPRKTQDLGGRRAWGWLAVSPGQSARPDGTALASEAVLLACHRRVGHEAPDEKVSHGLRAGPAPSSASHQRPLEPGDCALSSTSRETGIIMPAAPGCQEACGGQEQEASGASRLGYIPVPLLISVVAGGRSGLASLLDVPQLEGRRS